MVTISTDEPIAVAVVDWIGYDDLTPLDAASRSKADALVRWLRDRGARSAAS